ncbi:carbohydrate ABC transporter permease [Nocardiopsis aegyptia]|uniref:Multiple sugar transport system permease protein n=1 Tax=Nocardiopsis aegyptia TaxID=220378 RepID=A0A7Z0EJ38_9ACTN|nr:sugar ABC transporter permease [Nocardiopsis aegyptia]NYJ32936.1 multiple sugar transport system permease protein [Nocardiopsis aegyptia]
MSARERREALTGYAFVAPSALGVGLFVLLPMLLAFGLSFTSVNSFGQIDFVGWDNYRRMFADPQFAHSMRVTALYVGVFMPGVYLTALGMALLVNGDLPARAFFRTAFFAPYSVSLVVVALVWRYLLSDRIGAVGTVLRSVGVAPPSFLGDPDVALWTVTGISIWFLVGFYMIILLGGLQDIPRELYEAARLDGAGPWRTLVDIVLPMLRPTTFFVLILATIAGLAGLQAFDLVYVMTQGGPDRSTSIGIYFIYEQAFRFDQFGYASAVATWYAFALIVLTGAAFRLTGGGRFGHDDR